MRSNKGKVPPRYKHTIEENKSLWYRWSNIKRRCLRETDARYDEYGGRGIKMCQEWLESFDNFADWALSHGYEEHLTIERIDVNGDYCPENCKWIPRKEQAFNKRQTIWVDYRGRHIQLMKLCDELGLKYDTIHNRVTKMGWDIERAINEPTHTDIKSLMEKCKERGLIYGVVRDRINKLGWSEEEALSTPTGRGRYENQYAKRMVEEECKLCGAKFHKVIGFQQYCSEECRLIAKNQRRREKSRKTIT